MAEEKIPDGYTELRKVYESLQNEYAELRQEMKDGLRDQFAAAAMQGLMGNSGGPWQADPMCGTGWCNFDASLVALTAYDIADAMLAARERKEG
jgi:hypothetical protein